MMTPIKTKPRKTVEDYKRLPEGTRAELIEGEIFMSPSPRLRHQKIVGNIYRLLHKFVREHHLGQVFISPLDVHLPIGAVVEPDVIFVSDMNAAILGDYILGAPDLLVEALSPESRERDLVIKPAKYSQSGVKEYWIADGDTRTIVVKALSGNSYVDQGYFEKADTLVSPLLPGFEMRLAEIFE